MNLDGSESLTLDLREAYLAQVKRKGLVHYLDFALGGDGEVGRYRWESIANVTRRWLDGWWRGHSGWLFQIENHEGGHCLYLASFRTSIMPMRPKGIKPQVVRHCRLVRTPM